MASRLSEVYAVYNVSRSAIPAAGHGRALQWETLAILEAAFNEAWEVVSPT
jgi:hypothetical protein